MTTMVPVPICGREDWTILMPAERAARVQWPWHEWNRFHSMFHNLRLGDVLFDIGAEQGDQSALYQRWIQRQAFDEPFTTDVPGGHKDLIGTQSVREGGIVLVEPNPVAWANIKAVWEANDLREPLECFESFVGAEECNVSGSVIGWPVSARYQMASYVGTAEMNEGSVVTTIDELGDRIRPDAITIDIEGAELDALVGAKQCLTEDRPLVWVSVHWQQLLERGQSRQALIDYMHALGYKHEHLGEDHECHSFFWPEERTVVLPYDGVTSTYPDVDDDWPPSPFVEHGRTVMGMPPNDERPGS